MARQHVVHTIYGWGTGLNEESAWYTYLMHNGMHDKETEFEVVTCENFSHIAGGKVVADEIQNVYHVTLNEDEINKMYACVDEAEWIIDDIISRHL